MDKQILKMRDLFRDLANLIDEMEELSKREDNDEDVTKETESVIGRFTIKLLELESLK